MKVTFWLLEEPDFETAADIDPDRDWPLLKRGERVWLLQTYLRLRAAGYPVELSDRPVREGLVLFHARHRKRVMYSGRALESCALVGVRADQREALVADFEILQNGYHADGQRRFAIPHWPQPGLIERDPERGDRIENASFKGFETNLHPDYRSPEWHSGLHELGVAWREDTIAFRGVDTERQEVDWVDYASIDLVLAVRPPRHDLHRGKPASKLVNAWHAGVPAILGQEYAYRELRRSELDYLEVASAKEALEAVRSLKENPDLYRAMVENGHRRARELTVETIVSRWAELLFETLPPLAEEVLQQFDRRLPLPLRVFFRRRARELRWRPAK